MKQRFFERNEIHRFLKCYPWRVDELFECGAIKETPHGIYDKEVFCHAFQEEAYIKGTKVRPKPPKNIDLRSWIYFIEEESSNNIKIGISAMHPKTRLSGLQVGNPRKLALVGLTKGTVEDEAALHTRFVAHRIRGEWFRDNPELRALIAEKCPANDNCPGVAVDAA